MTTDEIQQVKFLFDAALQRFGVRAHIHPVMADSDELKVSFDLWGRHYAGDFILSDQGLRTSGTCFFWINAEIHVWQWIAMVLADNLEASQCRIPASPLEQQ